MTVRYLEYKHFIFCVYNVKRLEEKVICHLLPENREQRYRDTEIQRYRDTEIQRYRDTEIENTERTENMELP
jgi:hypothetical protein